MQYLVSFRDPINLTSQTGRDKDRTEGLKVAEGLKRACENTALTLKQEVRQRRRQEPLSSEESYIRVVSRK